MKIAKFISIFNRNKTQYNVEQNDDEFGPQKSKICDCRMFLLLNIRKTFLDEEFQLTQTNIAKARKKLFMLTCLQHDAKNKETGTVLYFFMFQEIKPHENYKLEKNDENVQEDF